jgi:hypothetical protein
VRDNVAFPLELAGVGKAERSARANQVIEHVGLQGFEDRYPNELSGGMRKRACLGRMLLYGAETALLDEPFAALDAQLKLAMHDLMLRLVSENRQTVVLVTHDLMEAVTLADRVLVCTRRPAMIAMEQRIDLARPRDVLNVRFSSAFKPALRRAVGAGCGSNITRTGCERGPRSRSGPAAASGRQRRRRDGAQPAGARPRRHPGLARRVRTADRQFLHLQPDRYRHTASGAGLSTARSSPTSARPVYATAMGFVIGSVGGAMLGVWLGVLAVRESAAQSVPQSP